MTIPIREMTLEDYAAVVNLWRTTEGIGLNEADCLPNLAKFLQHNPGMSFVAYDGKVLVGAVLCGHDGRRGYIHHLAVVRAYRRQGLGRRLVERCLAALKKAGIDKCHLFAFVENQLAQSFWQASGWSRRVELVLYSHLTGYQR